MTIEIEIKGADATNEMYDLRNFIQEQHLHGLQLQFKEQPAIDGTMSILAVATLVATITGELAIKAGLEMALEKPIHSLADTIKLWLKKRKAQGKGDIEVYSEQEGGKSYVTDSEGLTTELSRLNFAIDVKNTRVLLIGNSEFDFNFPAIKPVKGNVEDFYQMLTDKKIMGIPPENIILALDKTNGEIEEQMLLASKYPGIETLLIYYAGHGYKADAKKLFLVAKNSKKIGDHIINAVDFDFIKNVVLGQSTAAQKIVILDACHSGIATQGDNDFLAGFDVKGTYIFTSSSGDEVSYFNSAHKHTFFTGEMINVFRNGVENNHEKIALKDVYETVAANLKQKNFPEPRYKNDLNIPLSNFYIARNLKFSVEKWKQKARQLLLEGKTDEALREYNQLQQQYPGDEALKAEIEKSEKENQYLLLVNAADGFFRDQEYGDAIIKYNEALKIKQEYLVKARINKCEEYLVEKQKWQAKNAGGTTTINPAIEGAKEETKNEEPIDVGETNTIGEQTTITINPDTSTNQQTQKKWYVAAGIHLLLFGFGLFYVNPAIRRKWLYPLCILVVALVYLAVLIDIRTVQRDGYYIFRILFFGCGIVGYLGGLIDCMLTLNSNIPVKDQGMLPPLGKNLNNNVKAWVYIICFIWVIQSGLSLMSFYLSRRYIIDCDTCLPLMTRLEFFLLLILPPVIIISLLRSSRLGWILALFASSLKIAIACRILIAIRGYAAYSPSYEPLFNIMIAFICYSFLIFILNRPVVKKQYGVSSKSARRMVLLAAVFGILYIFISFVR